MVKILLQTGARKEISQSIATTSNVVFGILTVVLVKIPVFYELTSYRLAGRFGRIVLSATSRSRITIKKAERSTKLSTIFHQATRLRFPGGFNTGQEKSG
jgi:hypothetical protein